MPVCAQCDYEVVQEEMCECGCGSCIDCGCSDEGGYEEADVEE